MSIGTITAGAAIAVYGFIFVCIIFPSLIRVRAQYHFAVVFALLALGLDTIGSITTYGSAVNRVIAFFATLMIFAALTLLFLAAGGFTITDLATDFGTTLSELHGSRKSVIIPLTGAQPKPREQPEPPGERIDLTETQRPPGPPPPPPIPLE